MESSASSKINLYSSELWDKGEYTFTVIVLLTNYQSTKGISTFDRQIKVWTDDPCEKTELIPSITTLNVHAIIGIGDLVV